MIALRKRIERGLANPWLRPFLIVLLVVVLAFVALHAVHDGAATEAGAACIGIAILLSVALLEIVRVLMPPPVMLVRPGRAPPLAPRPVAAFATPSPIADPLRR